jgi:hypothetical protein
MNLQKNLPLTVLCVILFLGGCTTVAMVGAGAGAGMGTYSYVKGELKVDYPYTYDQTWNASLTALERLEIEVTTKKRDALNGEIKGKRGDEKSVVIKLKNKGLGITTVGVRVGSFGDRDASHRIQQTILNVLKS